MNINNHIIGKTVLEFQYNAPANSWRLQKSISNWVNGSLLPSIRDVFDTIPELKNHILLDKLELDLTVENFGNWEDSIVRQICEQLSHNLNKIILNVHEDVTEIKPIQQNFIDDWLYFIEYGVLPNLSVDFDFSELNSQSLFQQHTDQSRIDTFKRLLAQPQSRLRIAINTPKEGFKNILVYFFEFNENDVSSFIADTELIILEMSKSLSAYSEIGKESSFKKLKISILKTLPFVDYKFSNEFISIAMHEWLNDMPPIRLDVGGTWFSNLKSDIIKEAIVSKRSLSASKSDFAYELGMEDIISSTQESSKTANKEEPVFQIDFDNESDDQEIVSEKKELPEKAGIYVPNAGIVIIVPMFVAFFENLGLYAESQLQNTNMAIALMQYITNGNEKLEEYDAALFKVLAGIDINTSIDIPTKLPDAYINEAEELLTSVIMHWSVLKDTKTDGLREGFLQRNGKLIRKENGQWLLQVEQKSYDMLLDQLPWTISMIHLPWMKSILKTEWNS